MCSPFDLASCGERRKTYQLYILSYKYLRHIHSKAIAENISIAKNIDTKAPIETNNLFILIYLYEQGYQNIHDNYIFKKYIEREGAGGNGKKKDLSTNKTGSW